MLQAQEIMDMDEYKNLKTIRKRYGEYYDAMSMDRLVYFISYQDYHLILFEHFNSQLLNVALTTTFDYKNRQIFDVGKSNCLFVYPKQYLPTIPESYLKDGSKLHFYFAKRNRRYCMEQLELKWQDETLLWQKKNRICRPTFQELFSEEKQEGSAKILQFKRKQEEL